MLGAIIGDIVGSRFEWNNIKTKEFEFFTRNSFATDDSIMTLAVAKAILESEKNPDILKKTIAKHLQEVGRPYPNCGYGGMFHIWMYTDNPKPYNSYGNGAAMRVSPCGFAASSRRGQSTFQNRYRGHAQPPGGTKRCGGNHCSDISCTRRQKYP